MNKIRIRGTDEGPAFAAEGEVLRQIQKQVRKADPPLPKDDKGREQDSPFGSDGTYSLKHGRLLQISTDEVDQLLPQIGR